jgi:hypothetical protein
MLQLDGRVLLTQLLASSGIWFLVLKFSYAFDNLIIFVKNEKK